MHVLVLVPTSEEEVTRLKNVFKVVITALNLIPFNLFLKSFQTMLTTQSSTAYLKRRLARTIKTKIGILFFTSFMRKGYESSLQLVEQQRQLQQQIPSLASQVPLQLQSLQVLDEIQKAGASWKQMFATFYDNLTGKLSALLTTAMTTSEFTNSAPADQIWQFFVFYALNASPQMKEDIYSELSPILASVEQTEVVKTLSKMLGATPPPSQPPPPQQQQ